MEDWRVRRFLPVFTLILCVSGAPKPIDYPPVRVQCYNNRHILRRPLNIYNATVVTNTSILVDVRLRGLPGLFDEIACGSLYPKLIPCPFDERPGNAVISWQFCPEGKSSDHCEDRPRRSFYTFLLISGMDRSDRGIYNCRAMTPKRTIYERWEVRRTYSNWDLSWTNNSLWGFHVQLSESGKLQRFQELFIND